MGRVPGPADGLGVGAVSGRTLAAAEVARSALQTDAAGAEAQKEGRLQALRRCGWRSQLTADREVLNSHLAVVKASLAMPTWRPWRLRRRGRLNPADRSGADSFRKSPSCLAGSCQSGRSHPHLRGASRGGGYDLKKALERVAPDTEADHAGRIVDVFDRLGRHNAAPAGEEPRANSERIRHVGGGPVHRTLDPADNPTLVIGDEKSVQPAKVSSGDGHPEPTYRCPLKGNCDSCNCFVNSGVRCTLGA